MTAAIACGKFILGGEHSVVNQGRALGFPLRTLTLSIEESQSFDGLRVNGQARDDYEFRKILELRQILGAQGSVRGFDVQSNIPIGAGLGSSAALCTAFARLHSKENCPEAALQGERLFHGKASGIDPYTIAVGHPIVFRATDLSWRELDMSRFREGGLVFVLRDSGLRHRTVEVIEAVSRTRQDTPLIWEDLMDALATNVESMLRALETNPTRDLGRIMNDSHFRLMQLGVSNDTLDQLAEDLRKQGALGAKLTGAGRGGFVLSLFHKSELPSFPDGTLIVDV